MAVAGGENGISEEDVKELPKLLEQSQFRLRVKLFM